ncbi:hypothetical protein D910_07527 [Dendroctonus ponderosae]|uniref:Uncharacterized protein n=1 Tax=Dendroctonus ponderosae TaxID=77166 RepID=U4UCX5_DENPD|nr:hypothetical protein D910_07527 [Dendroctonus ponderosae]
MQWTDHTAPGTNPKLKLFGPQLMNAPKFGHFGKRKLMTILSGTKMYNCVAASKELKFNPKIGLTAALGSRVVKRSQRMVREVYPPDVDQDSEGNQPPVCIVGDVVYGVDETVPAEQPAVASRQECNVRLSNARRSPAAKPSIGQTDAVQTTNAVRMARINFYLLSGPQDVIDQDKVVNANTMATRMQTAKNSNPVQVENAKFATVEVARCNAPKFPATFATTAKAKESREPAVLSTTIVRRLVSEVFQHPPPVLRIGDKLLFLKKGNLVPEKDVTTPDSVITIIGAEGLQRGGVEESLEVHELKIEPEFAPIAPDQAAKTPEDLLLQSTDLPKPLGDLNASSDSNDLELRVSESTHILSLVKRKENPANSTTAAPPASTPIEELVNNLTIYKEDVTQSTLIETTTENLTKNTEPVAEQNPAYPPLPDIMPAGGENHQKADLELESSTKQTKIFLSEVNEFLTNQTKNDTHIEWLKTGPNQPNNASLKSFTAASLPEELLVQKSPIDEDMEPNIETTIASIGEVSDLLLPNFEKFEETLVADNQTTELPRNDSWADEGPQLIAEVKILEEPREEEEPLEEDKVQPASIEIKDAEDEPDCPINGTSPRSVESVEMDSGELTTPRTNHSSMVSAEAASVETFQPPTKSSLESVDLIQPASKESGVGLSSLEIIDSTSESILKDVELVDGKGEAPTVQSSSETNIMKHDVELIEVGSTPKPTKVSKIETSTYELLPTPEETQSRSILKRATSSEDEVFKDLEKELNEESSSSKSPEEDQSEAEEIFKQLAKETEQSHEENGPKNPDQEKSERLSKLVADVALKGQFPDINALRHLGLFGSQRK